MKPLDACRPFIDALKSSDPTPGGGAVAGLAGALAGALAHMVGSLTVGKKKFAAVEDEMREVMAKLDGIIEDFFALADDDARAFDAYMAAWRLPKGTDEEKAARKEALKGAAFTACDPPLRTVRLTNDLLPLISFVAERGNQHAISDAGAAAILAAAAARTAALNLRINLPSVAQADRPPLEDALSTLLPDVLTRAESLASTVEHRLDT
ncbi:MAG TPA: hypothetical protein ENK43_03230 [Planctomycetes bacterium]|nr:hypothetical protein [Planctomycetota bacterium]